MIDINKFIKEQLGNWQEVRQRFDELKNIRMRDIAVWCGSPYQLTLNPARVRSTAAKVDASAIAARPCFLCDKNRPAEQMSLSCHGMNILLNPFPIFHNHLTIVSQQHEPQSIAGRGALMAILALEMPGYTVFYNGPRCGASAPDHFHFQAAPAADLSLRNEYPFATSQFTTTVAEATATLDECMAQMPRSGWVSSDEEPPVNILCSAVDAHSVRFVVIPRRAHRPSIYGTGEGQVLMSPASADLAGRLVTVRQEDFDSLTPEKLAQIFAEICYDTI